MATPVHLGLIGAGRISRLHAENIAQRIPSARILIVSDPNEDAAKRCADDFRIKFALANYQQILASPAIHAVLICAPTYLHAQLIEEAAAAGKHIFCEKPIDFSLDKVDRALAAVAKAGVKVQIGFNRRFDANHQRVRQAVINGEIGEPHLLHIISRDPAPPSLEYIKGSGGLFFDMTIHDFDMARFLIGSEVVEVYASGAVRVDPQIGEAGDLDTAMIMLKFANGVIGMIDNSRQAVYGYDQRVEVFGSQGNVRTDNWHPNAAILSTNANVRRDLPLHFFMERYTESFVAEIKAFVEAVRNDQPTLVDGQDGRAPIVMALAARKSVEENRPVRISEIDG